MGQIIYSVIALNDMYIVSEHNESPCVVSYRDCTR